MVELCIRFIHGDKFIIRVGSDDVEEIHDHLSMVMGTSQNIVITDVYSNKHALNASNVLVVTSVGVVE